MLEGHTHSIAHLKQILRKLCNSELFLIFDHLTIACHCQLVLAHLLRELDACQLRLFVLAHSRIFKLLDALLESLDLGLLLIKQLFDALDIGSRQAALFFRLAR